MALLSQKLTDWLNEYADRIDQSNQYADELFQKLAEEGIFGIGVPEQFGGKGGDLSEIVQIIQELATHSLTAAFITWGHRTLIQNLVVSQNPAPRELWLKSLLAGERSGGTGLSNAVKFLSGIEELQVKISEKDGKWVLNGRLPWVTNLSKQGFVTIFVAEYEDKRKPPVIIAISSEAEGLERSKELELVALQGSNTTAVTFTDVILDERWIIAEDASAYLAKIRPAFLALQTAMAFGLAQRSLQEVEKSLQGSRSILQPELVQLQNQLATLQQKLAQGLSQDDHFITNPKELFQIRIDIVDVVAQSLLLELQASGGRGYLKNGGTQFIRRWREGAFLPVVTPSALQLKTILQS